MASGAMVGMTGKDRCGAIELFGEHDAHQLMRPGERAEGKDKGGCLMQGRVMAILVDPASGKRQGAADLRDPDGAVVSE